MAVPVVPFALPASPVFNVVSTVGDVDTAEILRLSDDRENVHTVPNGVEERYLAPMPHPGTERGVMFWGNLEFAPNADAMSYFVRQVWQPRLRAAGVRLRVIGVGAPDWLVELAGRESLLELSGFVSDLPAAVAAYPVMVNPMLTGSGLKNKVLEAFGLGAPVVSAPMGWRHCARSATASTWWSCRPVRISAAPCSTCSTPRSASSGCGPMPTRCTSATGGARSAGPGPRYTRRPARSAPGGRGPPGLDFSDG